jgi:hypothetical protein
MQPANPNVAAEIPRANGHSTVQDIFLLSDEQILEIDPGPQEVEISAATRPAPSQSADPASSPVAARLAPPAAKGADAPTGGASASPTNTLTVPEPPAWLAAQMKDAWNGAEARALWERVQGSENEAAAYREVFANPEDARAVKALYPGGVAEAQATAERARLLDDIDRAYFGSQGSTPEQARASRAELAQMMLRQDPAAFREMVFEGLRAIDTAEGARRTPSIADAFGGVSQVHSTAAQGNAFPVGARLAPPGANGADTSTGGASPSPTAQGAHPARAGMPAPPEHLASYAAFEKAANAELEKTVGSAIERALHQALPNGGARLSASPGGGTHEAAPLQARLSQAIREDVERALQGDRQLGEQVAQILASRRFDEQTRAQVVRLINDRALQLVPGAAKRALNDWTQATLAAHRSRTTRSEAAASRREVTTAAPVPRDVRTPNQNTTQQNSAHRTARSDQGPTSHSRVNYGKLSDEQILDL